jgi:hypothetical protein
LEVGVLTDNNLSEFNKEMEVYTYFYTNYNQFFDEVSKIVLYYLNNQVKKKEENEIINSLLKISKKILIITKSDKKVENFLSEIITNLILLSFQPKHLNELIYESKDIWYERHKCITNFIGLLNNFYLYYSKDSEHLIIKTTNLKKISLILFELLVNNGLIKTFKANKKKKQFIRYKLNLQNLELILNYKIYINEPVLIQYRDNLYFVGVHFFSMDPVFKENIRSDKKFKLTDIEFVEKIKKLKYYIDWTFYDNICNLIAKHYHCNKNTLFEEFLEAIPNIQILRSQKNIQIVFSEFLIIVQFLQLKKNLQKYNFFYFSYSFDFRGRLYPNSTISHIGPIIYRCLYYYGYYTETELEKIKLQSLSDDVLSLLKQSIIWQKFQNLSNENKIHLEYVYRILFEIGKIFKNDFLELYNGRLNVTDFLTIGDNKFKQFFEGIITNISLEENIQLHLYLNVLENLNDNKYKKQPIYKDATASSIQLLAIVLGVKNNTILEVCNLQSNCYWYDPYYYIIEEFKKTNPIPTHIIKFFKRKYLKKTIMTYNYSITYLTALKDFLEVCSYTEKEELDLIINFKNFFKYLTSVFEEGHFYAEPSTTLIQKFKQSLRVFNKLTFYTNDFSEICLEYYKVKKIRADRIVEGRRVTIQFDELSDELDEIKSLRALRANLIHCLDASYLRLVINNYRAIYTVHDSFGVEILDVDNFTEIANTSINNVFGYNELYFCKKFNIRYYSPFILL